MPPVHMTRQGSYIKIDIPDRCKSVSIHQIFDIQKLHEYPGLISHSDCWQLVTEPIYDNAPLMFFKSIYVENNRYLHIKIDPVKFKSEQQHKRVISVQNRASKKYLDITCEIDTGYQEKTDLTLPFIEITELFFYIFINIFTELW